MIRDVLGMGDLYLKWFTLYWKVTDFWKKKIETHMNIHKNNYFWPKTVMYIVCIRKIMRVKNKTGCAGKPLEEWQNQNTR